MTGQEVIKRYDAIGKNYRGNWETLWQEAADWSWPTNDNVNNVHTPGAEKPPQRLIDTCIEANYNFASGFFSHMFTPNMLWAKFRHPSPEMMQIPVVAAYFEKVSRVVHEVLIGSNFSQEEFQSLLAMGCFGTNCLSVEEDDKKIVRFRNFTISGIRLDQNHLGEIDTVGREFEYTGKQAVQKFGMEALEKADLKHVIECAKNSDEKKFKFVHLVTPRMEYDPSSKKSTDKPFASYYACRTGNVMVKEGGFDYNPYVTGRFTVGNDEIYGRGPMLMLLATARRTNVIYRTMLLNAEQNSTMHVLVPDDDSVKGFKRRALDFIKWRASNPNGKPEILKYGDLNTPIEMYQLHDDQIKRMFFNHLFRPLEDYRNMTATEVNERMTTDLMALAPFVARYQDEHVSPLMNYVYYVCQKRKMMPKPPPELDKDPGFEIDYVGRLSLATKSFETLGAINTARIFMELAQGDSRFIEALDYMNHDDMFIKTWFANSASMSSLRGEEEVAQTRQVRQQAAAQQRMVDNLAPVADAAQKLSGKVDESSIVGQAMQ